MIGKRPKTATKNGVIILHHDRLYYEVSIQQLPNHLIATVGVGRLLAAVLNGILQEVVYTGQLVPSTTFVTINRPLPRNNVIRSGFFELIYVGQKVYSDLTKDRLWSTICKYPEQFMAEFDLLTYEELLEMVPIANRCPNCYEHLTF